MTTLESTSSGGRVRDALSGRPKVAIVTGASSGIGLEMVKRLIEKGYPVVANSRNITSSGMTLYGTADLKLVDGDIGLIAEQLRNDGQVGDYRFVRRISTDTHVFTDTVSLGQKVVAFRTCDLMRPVDRQ